MKRMHKTKKLYIIRHAKSSWKDEALDDFDRPLNKRGKRDAPFMVKMLKERGVAPDIIISSSAKRAKATAKIIAKGIGYDKDIVFDKEIYESSLDTLHKIVAKVDDGLNTLFLIGHNPSLNMLAQEYVCFDENIPTCGVVEIEFECGRWAEISAKNAKLISFEYPKKYL